jgi:hypothetical protein
MADLGATMMILYEVSCLLLIYIVYVCCGTILRALFPCPGLCLNLV